MQASCDYPLGGTWTRLYSSSQHGFSMNRFQHHCSDYREPSVMVLDCRCQRGEEEGGDGRHQFAIAVDTEWKSASCSWSCAKFAKQTVFISEMEHSFGEGRDSACYNFNQFSFYFHVRYIGNHSKNEDTSLTRTHFLSQKSNSYPPIRTPHY